MLNLRKKLEKIKRGFRFGKKRQLIFGGVFAVFLIGGFGLWGILKIKGATFGWTQSDWSGGADLSAKASHLTDQLGWTKFYAKDASLDTSGGEIKLTGTTNSVVETTSVDFSSGTNTKVYATGTGTAGTLYAQKPDGGTCTTATQCQSGFCSITAGGVCSLCGGTVNGGSGDANTYGMVLGADGNCWLDRNLGATRVAQTKTDTSAYGWYYQWGRATDGHQLASASATTTLSPTDTVAFPDTAKFIINNSANYDWKTNATKNDNLWQGIAGVNNPCPTGFRLPTATEFGTLINALGFTGCTSTCDDKLFASTLKLPLAGARFTSGSWYYQGSYGFYWSSSPSGTYAANLYFYSTNVAPAYTNNRAYGFSVRCLKN